MGLLGSIGKVVGLDDLIAEIGSTVRQVLPNKQAQRDFDLKLAEIADRHQDRIHAEVAGQLEINKTEAGHASIFVAGWRPAIGWICAAGLGWNFVLAPLLIALGLTPGMAQIEQLLALVGAMLGWSGFRTFEVVKGVHRETLKGQRGPQPSVPEAPEPLVELPEPEPEAEPLSLDRQIAWGSKVDAQFKAGVLWIEEQLGIKADYLMACMAFETGGTFSPKVKNAAGSSGLGLIQFMRATHTAMLKQFPQLASSAPTHADLAKLSAVKQLGWVYYYFKSFREDYSAMTLEDIYMTILFPRAVGKPLDWRMPWKYGELAYKQNSGLDRNRDRVITKAEASSGVRRMYDLGMQQKG